MSAQSIGENTPVKIGLVILLVGALTGPVWWASSISTKMDLIIKNQTDATALLTQQSIEVKSLEKRVALLEMVGAPPIVAQLEVIRKQIADLNTKVILSGGN